MPKILKNKKEIESDGILLKFWISNISIFFWKKTVVFQNCWINSRIDTLKQHKNFEIFLKTIDRHIEKKDVQNTKK